MSLLRLYHNSVRGFRIIYRFFRRPVTTGVKCIIQCDGRLLLVRIAYGHRHWTFPGGGIEPGETPSMAALRETREEVGIAPQQLEYLGTYFSTRNYARDTVHCFYARILSQQAVRVITDPLEIAEAGWFHHHSFPVDFSEGARDAMELLRQRHPLSFS